MTKVLFSRDYSDESLYDVGQDIEDAVSDLNPVYKTLPRWADTPEFRSGTFTVTITWSPDE